MIYVITIAIYLIGLVIIGFFKAKQIKTQSDFSVAGRALTPWVLVGTMLATWMGTGSILGNAGKTYQSGMAGLWLPLGSVLGIIILTQIAGKVRSYNKFTVPEIIGERYGQVARLLSVIALVLAYMVIVSYQYNAGGAVLYTVFSNQIDSQLFTIETATIIAAIFIISYTMLAGLLSVAFTDAANGILMTISLVIAFPILWIKAGGLNGMELAFESMNKSSHMQFFSVFSAFDIINFCLPPFLLVLFLFLPFPIFSDINKNPFELIDIKSQEMVVVLTSENELFNTNPELFKNKIKNIFEPLIDFNRVSASVMGKKYYLIATKEERAEFIEVFKISLLDTYAETLAQWGDAEIITDFSYDEKKNKIISIKQNLLTTNNTVSYTHLTLPTKRIE